jgi:serine/threonine protein kinase
MRPEGRTLSAHLAFCLCFGKEGVKNRLKFVTEKRDNTCSPVTRTEAYEAPEVRNCAYSKKVDKWSMGVVLIELMIEDFYIPSHPVIYCDEPQAAVICGDQKGKQQFRGYFLLNVHVSITLAGDNYKNSC